MSTRTSWTTDQRAGMPSGNADAWGQPDEPTHRKSYVIALGLLVVYLSCSAACVAGTLLLPEPSSFRVERLPAAPEPLVVVAVAGETLQIDFLQVAAGTRVRSSEVFVQLQDDSGAFMQTRKVETRITDYPYFLRGKFAVPTATQDFADLMGTLEGRVDFDIGEPFVLNWPIRLRVVPREAAPSDDWPLTAKYFLFCSLGTALWLVGLAGVWLNLQAARTLGQGRSVGGET